MLFNVIGEIAPWSTKVLEAKIPIFPYSSADGSLLKGGDVFTMSNPIASLAAFPASIAKNVSNPLLGSAHGPSISPS